MAASFESQPRPEARDALEVAEENHMNQNNKPTDPRQVQKMVLDVCAQEQECQIEQARLHQQQMDDIYKSSQFGIRKPKKRTVGDM
jgi:hypothetical protein